MILHGIFPTPVARFNLDREFTERELEFVLKQSQHKTKATRQATITTSSTTLS